MKNRSLYHSHKKKSIEQANKYNTTKNSLSRYLAYRDLPHLLEKYASGVEALDYGCGTGISSNFLAQQGFEVVGVDVDEKMLNKAQLEYPNIEFSLLKKERPQFPPNSFDLIFSSFVLFELASKNKILSYLKVANKMLRKDGVMIIITGSEVMYSNDWLVMETDFPENKLLRSGKKVKIFLPDVDMEITDYYWTENDYRSLFDKSGFKVINTHHPLGRNEEIYEWKDEKFSSPFVIFILKTEKK